MKTIPLGVKKISIDDLAAIARQNVGVRLEKEAESRIIKARKLVEKWVKEGKTIYGITTGFGALNNVIIPRKDLRRLQKNIILSHSAGVGNPLNEGNCSGRYGA